jgi:two-component system sensor histidine kinase AlgZ
MRDNLPAGQPTEVHPAVAVDAPRHPPSSPAAAPATPAPASPNAPASGTPSRRVSDGAKAPVLPDCCNMGIAVRVLVPLNVAALLLALAGGAADASVPDRLVEIAMVLEPAALLSLLALCVLRRHVNGRARSLQWGVGIGVPAAATLLVSLAAATVLVPQAGPLALGLWVGVRALAAAALAALAIEYFRLRALSLSPSLSEARLQALQARIRPHFLFNSLNTVLGLMRGDPRRAEYTLENLADLFRVFMRDTRELVPLDEEVVTCQQYLAIEQLRLGDRLNVRWQVEQMPGDALLPSLLLQPLIENAVHHGIEPREVPGEILISITRPGDRVRVEILNPAGEGAPVRPGNQMALSNVRERLMLLYDMEAELKTAEEDGQFCLLLEFPYRKERRRRDVRRHFNPYR